MKCISVCMWQNVTNNIPEKVGTSPKCPTPENSSESESDETNSSSEENVPQKFSSKS